MRRERGEAVFLHCSEIRFYREKDECKCSVLYTKNNVQATLPSSAQLSNLNQLAHLRFLISHTVWLLLYRIREQNSPKQFTAETHMHN